MSAPSTLVFLLPVALHTPGILCGVLEKAWHDHDLAGARERPEEHPYVRLAAQLSDASVDGCCRLLLTAPSPALHTWIEQVLEQSLGKGGKGVAVFVDRGGPYPEWGTHRLAVAVKSDLAVLAATFLGWQLCAAMYGYLHGICVVDEPAVEIYKAHARQLRELPDPYTAIGKTVDTTEVVDALRAKPSYVDITVNGEPGPQTWERLERRVQALVDTLGVPAKLRRAPAAYHVSEQSEMDGPGPVVSLRTALRKVTPVRRGTYADRFLPAQAVATWKAMNEQGRTCFLLLLDDHDELDGILGELSRTLKENS
jgi:hypothetical protein